jgi:exodeoxyribonuclease V alpha subunit
MIANWNTLLPLVSQGKLELIDLVFAESVLKKLGSKEEAHAALLATLFALSRQGHLAFSEEMLPSLLLEEIAPLVRRGIETFPQEGITQNPTGRPSEWVCQTGDHLYLQKNWVQESEILISLMRLNQSGAEVPPPVCDSRMNAEQRQAVSTGMQHNFSLLTGGPGTGKTFTAAAIVKAHLSSLSAEQRTHFRLILSAPTGKAASHLEASLRKELGTELPLRSGTLHSLLGVKEHSYEEESQPLFADLILIDECSMIDSRLFSRLLASIQTSTRVVLIGDQDQLPPVEAGSIFADLVDSNCFPTTRLTQVLRSESKEILSLANAIKHANAEEALNLAEWTDLEEGKKSISQLYNTLWERYQEKFPLPLSEKPIPEQIFGQSGAFTLLSCMRKGPLGVDALNSFFLNQSIRGADSGSWLPLPIMITRNDSELELFNGDQGLLVRQVSLDFSFKELQMQDYALFADRKGGYRMFPALTLGSFEYSYCQSVHKSQGSEYSEVLILVPGGSEVFGREVLYTAVTRAKHKVALAGSRETFLQSVGSSSRKVSGLKERLLRD